LVATGQRGKEEVVGDSLGGDPSRKSSGAEFGKPLEEIANTNNDHKTNNNNNDHNNNNNEGNITFKNKQKRLKEK
jgi:hypothetical protein